MKNQEIINRIESQTNELINIGNYFSTEMFNEKTESGKWSIGQVFEHLYLCDKTFKNVLTGPESICHRQTGLHLEHIKSSLSDHTIRFIASDMYSPSDGHQEKHRILQDLSDLRKEILSIIREKDLELICKLTKHPEYGYLTGREWVQIMIYHTDRHLHKILAAQVF